MSGFSNDGDAMIGINRTRFPCKNPNIEDCFTRGQIVVYLEEIPLGYRTEQEHKFAEQLIMTIQAHFAELDNSWQPTID